MSVLVSFIDERCRDQALALLVEGFPERSASFWSDAIQALETHAVLTNSGPIGWLMYVGGEPVGVILTIASQRANGSTVINLSSWYVRQKYRWQAPRMLQTVTADSSSTYTDISPSAEMARLNTALGFKTVTDRVAFFPLTVTAVLGKTSGRIERFGPKSETNLSAENAALLSAHERLGCLCAVYEVEGHHRPLIFSNSQRYGRMVTRVLYADDRRLMAQNGAGVARFLLRHGALALTMATNENEKFPTAFLRKSAAPVQVKGAWRSECVDKAFSELVFLKL